MLAQFPEPEAHDKVLDNNPDQGQEPTAKLDPHTKPSPAIKTGADRWGGGEECSHHCVIPTPCGSTDHVSLVTRGL